jgi:hypothetical protein
VPTPEKSRVVVGGKPVSTGTRKVAPNIATTCWAPMPTVRPQFFGCDDEVRVGSRVDLFPCQRDHEEYCRRTR